MPIFLREISKRYDSHQILESFTLTIEDGKTTILIGPNGCGKSTLLRLICGLTPACSGTIKIDGEDIHTKTIHGFRKKIGYVIQEGGLFPHLTAKDNISLFARYLKFSNDYIQQKIVFLSNLVQLPLSILESYPVQLSGGERQRVSLIRALMLDPPYLLMDEPLSALDTIIRYELMQQLKQIFSFLKKTVIFVTHDMREAAYLGDQIVLMRSGQIVQKGTFNELLQQPSDPFVKDFITAQEYPLEADP